MSYQPPGSYPVMPQYPGGAGMPPKPPIPQTVQRAHYCLLGGALLSVIGAGLTFTEISTIRTTLQQGLPADTSQTINTLVTGALVVAVVVGLIEAGLWIWMAYATKAGKNWARILSSVFFGIDTAGVLFGGIGFFASSNSGSSNSTFASSQTVPGQIVGWVTFLVGLAAIVLMWNKASGPYFKPAQYYAAPYGYGYPTPPGAMPGGVPGQQPYPYTYPVMPGQQGPGPQAPVQDPAAQQGPGDPWGTPPTGS